MRNKSNPVTVNQLVSYLNHHIEKGNLNGEEGVAFSYETLDESDNVFDVDIVETNNGTTVVLMNHQMTLESHGVPEAIVETRKVLNDLVKELCGEEMSTDETDKLISECLRRFKNN